MGTGFALVCYFGVNGQTAIGVPVPKLSLVKCYQSNSVFFSFLPFFVHYPVCVLGGDHCFVCSGSLFFCVGPEFCSGTASALPMCHFDFYAKASLCRITGSVTSFYSAGVKI